ncbi:RteC domain-containing protein [Maribacter flavus]|uniref:RteC protein n=1 Tax=Maribacter flavus TaxID=1658664 RepID=A0A5B2TX51_9FLAO|nr:RteC domain-containing protein [Maribacter flavus]KAA2218548.1 hypothetical protein F0361_02695 [Maribacter flavus]
MAFEKTMVFMYFPEHLKWDSHSDKEQIEIEKIVWEEENGLELKNIFEAEYQELINKKEVFNGCPFEVYRSHYNTRAQEYNKKFPDSLEVDFIIDEMYQFAILPDFYPGRYDEIGKKIRFSRKRTYSFLFEKAKQLGYEIKESEDKYGLPKFTYNSNGSGQTSQLLDWHGDKSNLIELVKALIENGNLKGQQKEIFKVFENIFGLELNQDKTISGFKNRISENETKFIDDLRKSLKEYIASTSEKNR